MNYTLTITEEERQKLAEAFAIMARKIGSCAPVLDSPKSSPLPQAVQPPSTPAKSAAPTLPEPRDRWARDKKGNEVPWPKDCYEAEVNIWKVEQKPGKVAGSHYWKVTWQADGRGYADANCFDRELGPWLINQQGHKTTLYLVKNGNYLNVVGVRA